MSEITKQKNNSELLIDVLDTLVNHNADILSALVVSDDGLTVASGIPHKDDDNIGLIASDLVDMASDFSQKLEQGHLNRVMIEGEQRTTIIFKAGKRTVLAVLLTADAKLGLLIQSMRRAAQQISEIFN